MDLLALSLPSLLKGLGTTILLGVVSFILGFMLSGLITLARTSRFPVLKGAAIAYVSLFRGTPLLIQIMLIYFGLPQLVVRIPHIPSAILAFTLSSAACLTENFRGGIQAVDKGQWEAAGSMGMTYGQSLRRIIYP